MKRGRKRNPFLVKNFASKTFSYERGRIYEYGYYHSDFFPDEYCLYLESEEIKKLNKEKDVVKWVLDIWIEIYGEESVKYMPVKFTKEEFINFKRLKIIEKNIKGE